MDSVVERLFLGCLDCLDDAAMVVYAWQLNGIVCAIGGGLYNVCGLCALGGVVGAGAEEDSEDAALHDVEIGDKLRKCSRNTDDLF